MKTSFSALLASIAVLAALGLAAPTRADLIASYSPDDLTATASPTNIVTMNDDSGHGNPLSGGIYPTLYGSTTGGYNSIFNGRNYANYADQSKAGLETSGALFSALCIEPSSRCTPRRPLMPA